MRCVAEAGARLAGAVRARCRPLHAASSLFRCRGGIPIFQVHHSALAVRMLSSSSDPLKDPAIAAAIEKERASRAAAKSEKLGRSLMETLSDHRDELFNIMLAALLVVLTLKMLREKVCPLPCSLLRPAPRYRDLCRHQLALH